MQHVPQIRVFLASPGDVNEERAITLEVLDRLEYDPLFKRNGASGVSIHAVAWDKPGAGTPMRATMTPQTAIKQGLPSPSDCDIVVVLFWGRMGTPLPHPEYQKEDGSPYLSGTEWEFSAALAAERKHGKPITLLYRRTEEPHIEMKDRKAIAQYHAVLDFFDQFRDPITGALTGGINEYKTPEEFRQNLTDHLRGIIDSILIDRHSNPSRPGTTAPSAVVVEAPPLWQGSPFPGLRAFGEKDAPLFFGRGIETSELIKRVEQSRFVGVVAASGSGKSSLVAAGLIPRLKANAIVNGETSSGDWRYVTLKPGDNPFAALFDGLCAAFPEHVVLPSAMAREWNEFAEGVKAGGNAFIDFCHKLLAEADAPAWAEMLFFVDQFEELFTLVKEDDRAVFVKLLEKIHASSKLRCVVTMRSDFYANCAELPALAALLNAGNYTLAAPTAGALVEMIKRPAERAGLIWDNGLPEQIQADTGSEAGALALMAYALDELYKVSQVRDNKRLTVGDYATIGGVAGAIGKRAESVFGKITASNKDQLLQRVFRELVVVDERGTATRQRFPLNKFSTDELALIHAFADARLLVIDENSVEIAHEAVFRSWKRLREWIMGAQDDLILLRQVRLAADEWVRKGRPDFLRWPAERLNPVEAMIRRQQPTLQASEQDFIEPEQSRLLRELDDLDTTHERRRDIGDRLAVIGDTRPGIGVKDGLPDITWLPVPVLPEPIMMRIGSSEIGPITIAPFFIAQYQITFPQFQAFIDAKDGYHLERWWSEMPNAYKKQDLVNQRTKTANSPRENVSWYQAVAFARWLNHRLRGQVLHSLSGTVLTIGENAQVRLPLEWEWQWAAQSGTKKLKYPWGNWREGFANTSEAGLTRTAAVGIYPQGSAGCGALDMAGNLFEWCQNDKQDFKIINGYSNDKSKVLRGGSFLHAQGNAACAYRDYSNAPYTSYDDAGVRLVVGAILSDHLARK